MLSSDNGPPGTGLGIHVLNTFTCLVISPSSILPSILLFFTAERRSPQNPRLLGWMTSVFCTVSRKNAGCVCMVPCLGAVSDGHHFE
jgi:hypothetical protein